MNKILIGLAAAMLSCCQLSAQPTAFVPGKLWDNWQVGINGGVESVTTHNEILSNLNPRAGVRVTRFITPVIGLALQGSASFGNKPFPASRGALKATNLDLLTMLNLSNWTQGYIGQPRIIEVSAVVGLGWGHLHGLKRPRVTEETLAEPTVLPSQMDKNAFMGKIALDVAYTFGNERQWQVYLEPAINYHLDATGDVEINLSKSAVALTAGISYRLPNSNGRQHMAAGKLRDQQELDRLNQQVNELRAELKAKEAQQARDSRLIKDLKSRLDKLGGIKPSDFDLNQ